MALSPSLQQFKSSGVYRLEFDKSQITNIPSETIRLIIGFSKKGPFNTPIFVQDSVFFKTVFGDIDSTLERKGSFFHRTVLTCLDRGPVIVLNLLNLNDDQDQSDFRSISTSASQDNSPVTDAPVSSYFNKDKFWFTDANALVETADNTDYQSATNQRLLNVANVGRKTVSVITKKSDMLGFDVLAKDWFGVGKVPPYLRENDYISDYMVDVIVVEGDFSNYNLLLTDPIFGSYFDVKGLKKIYVDEYGFNRDGLTSFLNLDQVNVLGVYSGALLPDFQDKNGANMFIEDLVNLETSKTGVLLGLNKDTFDDDSDTISGDIIDLVGHSIESEQPGVLEFLSYYGAITEFFTYTGATGSPRSITAGATTAAGVTANAFLSGSTSLAGASGYAGTGVTGYYDTLTIYGPSATMPSAGYSSAYNTTTWAAARAAILNGQSYAKVAQRVVSGPTGSVNYSRLISSSYNSDLDTLTIRIGLTAGAGVVGPTVINGTTGQGFYYFDYPGNGSTGATDGGGTAGIRIIDSLNFLAKDSANGGTALVAGPNSTIYANNLSGLITDGDGLMIGASGATLPYAFINFNRSAVSDLGGATGISGNSIFGSESPVLNQVVNYLTAYAFEYTGLTGATVIGATGDFKVRTYTGDINESFLLTGTYTNPTTTIYVDNSSNGPLGDGGFTGQIQVGQYLVMNHGGTGTITIIDPLTGKSRLTRIISVSEDSNPLSATYKRITIKTNDPIYISPTNEVERYKDIKDFVGHYKFTALDGYTLRNEQMPNGSADRQNAILDVMYNSNIAQALEDREVITFRYIIDTFAGVIEPASKIRLSRLAKNRQSALAICNMPSVKQFKDSTNPIFKLESNTSFDTQYVPTGGNLSKNPSNVFNLPGIADGANYSAFYGPNLIIRENGHNISVPPAGHVSNLYIDKYNLALPYSIVAGPRRGVVTGQGLVGVEYAFDRVDLDWIEPFGYNAIVNKRGFGLVINANQTAQQTVKSALSQIHVRELLIYIQDGIEAILKNYRWEFNTAQNRLEIKTLADNFLSQILADSGVYDFQNIMDNTNNTTEIIDNNIGILDTYIEPVRGMGILVHRTTILRTGSIATGNFL
jgi:hypothetical protein